MNSFLHSGRTIGEIVLPKSFVLLRRLWLDLTAARSLSKNTYRTIYNIYKGKHFQANIDSLVHVDIYVLTQ